MKQFFSGNTRPISFADATKMYIRKSVVQLYINDLAKLSDEDPLKQTIVLVI